MRLSFLLFLFLFIGIASTAAQRFLQMERSGTYKVKRYYAGESVTFRIAGDRTWYTEDIVEILVEESLIVFTNRAIRIEDISHLRRFNMRRWSKPIGRQLYNFGLGWLVFSLGGTLLGTPLTMAVVWIPLTAGATGFLIQKIFRHRTFKMGNNRRLRVMDLSFKGSLSP